MQIFNTLTRKKEEFIPLNPKEIGMYICGPTIYDFFHIGNGRSFIMADIIRRYLEYKGFDVNFVMNLTDVDDKIINKSIEEGVDPKEITERYEKAFFEDIKKLKIKKANIYPKATEHMDEIIAMIKKLVDDDTAYNVDGNVFYEIEKFEGYGKLSGKKIEDLEAGSRIEIIQEKKSPFDFTLWKKAKDGEPYWDSPWGKGRPGWHAECSAMSMKHLGQQFDIHAGGTDLVFPHHENEIAQSEACTGHKFVNYWIHFGFLNFKDEKMSKSLGNFFTARDIVEKYSAEEVRLFLCQTHYASPLSFSDELLDTAKSAIEKFNNVVSIINKKLNSDIYQTGKEFDFQKFYEEFEKSMDDDFNMPKATAVIFEFVKEFNKYVTETGGNIEFYNSSKKFLKATAEDVLGILDTNPVVESNNNSGIEEQLMELIISLRADAKKNKNYDLADAIRNKLDALSIELKDSKEGTTYKIK